jgi:hypothetical protein
VLLYVAAKRRTISPPWERHRFSAWVRIRSPMGIRGTDGGQVEHQVLVAGADDTDDHATDIGGRPGVEVPGDGDRHPRALHPDNDAEISRQHASPLVGTGPSYSRFVA